MSYELEKLSLPDGVDLDRRGQALRGILSNITGLTLHSAYEGTFAIGSSQAQVTIDSEALRVRLNLAEAQQAWDVLQTMHALPTNLRYALIDEQLAVVGEAPLAVDTLAESLLHIATGLRMALGKRPRGKSSEALTPAAVEAVLRQAEFAPEDIVRHEGAWQLHLRMLYEATPLTLAIDGGDLIVMRKIVSLAGESAPRDEVAHAALQTNARLRHCRLALDDGHLVVEARLPGGLLSAAALVHHARGVALAARQVRFTFEIMIHAAEAAIHFRRMFRTCK